MNAAGEMTRGPNPRVKVLTTMKDFIILSKIGKSSLSYIPLSKQLTCGLGDGAYSEVYKVKRNSDHQVYALKKVKLIIRAPSLD